jgi:hypothetical protein
MSMEGHRPPAHPAGTAPSEFVNRAWGDPSLLTDRERSLLMRLAINNLCRQTGCDERTAATALDHFAERGESVIRGDQCDVYLEVCGAVHIHATREWLRWAASRPSARPTPTRLLSFPM